VLSSRTIVYGIVCSIIQNLCLWLTLTPAKLTPGRKNCIRLTNYRESLATRLGSNPDKSVYPIGISEAATDCGLVPRVENIHAVSMVPDNIWDTLGITRSTATPGEQTPVDSLPKC
jgi:hypothetical protein